VPAATPVVVEPPKQSTRLLRAFTSALLGEKPLTQPVKKNIPKLDFD
jgi:hypothetical protein